MADKTFVIGHKSPDLDSIAAAIAYAEYKNREIPDGSFVPVSAGDLNQETVYVLNKFGMKSPETAIDASGKNFILVDHNEFSQAIDNMSQAKISEIVDHHKMDFKYSEPIRIDVRPWGSSCSIIADMFMEAGYVIGKELSGVMLAAILVDTVITKSPTCTDKDKEIIEKLSSLAGISDWKEFGMEIFRIRSNVKNLKAAEIVKSDFKDFVFKAGKFGIGQVETVDLKEFSGREDELLTELDRLRTDGAYHSTVLFITDIINEGSQFLVSTSDQGKAEEALGRKLTGGKVYIEGVISRKKQVAPKFTEVFDK